MKLYLIGAVTGKPDRNKAKFDDAICKLALSEIWAISPLHAIPEDLDWKSAMRRSIGRMLCDDIDGVAYLDDWQESRGARIEKQLCEDLVIPIASVDEWLKEDDEEDDDEY